MSFVYLKPCPFCGNDQLSVARGPVAYRNDKSDDALKVAALRRWEERADG